VAVLLMDTKRARRAAAERIQGAVEQRSAVAGVIAAQQDAAARWNDRCTAAITAATATARLSDGRVER
jgi:hypothetical protein